MQTKDATLAELRHLNALKSLDDIEIGLLAQVALCRTIAAGTMLFAEGDEHLSLYFVVDGSLQLQMARSQAAKQTLLSVGAGELLAWSA
ncbi:MAG: cyclic nucleotide-binding domain-containing protein, partial [Aureliella sp.]